MAPLFFWAFLIFSQYLASAETWESNDDATVLMQTSLVQRSSRARVRAEAQAAKPIVRPSAGKGPEHIEFGLRTKKFYGIDTKANEFEMDLVITLKWTDKRTAKLIPKGAQNLTLSQSQAQANVWLPEIAITDRDVKKKDVISTAVMLHKDGRVFKVQRIIADMKDKYDLKEFPFDKQDVVVKIASSQYMSSEVVLVPSNAPDMSGVAEGLIKGAFDMDSWKVSAYEDDNGLLKKSRGRLTIKVSRGFMPYFNSHLIPSIAVAGLSCGVFYFPFIGPFVTPRLAMSVFSYLAFVGLAGMSNAPLPPIKPSTWNDILNGNIELCMIVGAAFNIYTEVKHHITKVEDVALKINGEMKLVMPLLCLLCFALTLIFGFLHSSQMAVDLILKTIVLLTSICLVYVGESRTTEALAAKEAAKPPEEKPAQ